jgi:hypothetical protein
MEYERNARSHVGKDGAAKATFPTEQAAQSRAVQLESITGRPFSFYLCEQRPDHWHLGSSRNNR